MAAELRGDYHRNIDRLDISLGALFSVLPEAVDNATAALLSADIAQRSEIDRWQQMVAAISADVDHTAELLIARQAPVAGDLRFLLACVRLVQNVSDTIDLVAQVGGSLACAWDAPLPDRLAQLVVATGDASADTWRSVADLWHQRPSPAMVILRTRDDRLQETRAALAGAISSSDLTSTVVSDLAGTARSYEWIGHHALVAGRLIDTLPPRLADPDMPPEADGPPPPIEPETP